MNRVNRKQTVKGEAIANIPWEEKPADCKTVVWRSKRNPIIPRDLLLNSNSIFNSAVVPFNGEFAGVFRCDNKARRMVIHRTEPYILSPQTLDECVGDVPNVVFPVAALCDAPTGRMAIYYGAADTVVCLAFTQVDDLIDFVKSNSIVR